MARSHSMWRLGIPLAGLVMVLDQLTKWVILSQVMQPPRGIEVTPFFNLVLAWNRGISFSLLTNDTAAGPFILAGMAGAIVLGLAWWLGRIDRRWPAVGIGLVMGGALGNIIDRLRYGAVVDFLDFHLAGWHWPAFNLADAAITVGVGMLIVDGLFDKPERAK
ncbi:signal peptidase II [Virgifigura deserti]|uniref:signal peptidase II n=1 Tax=Virgifigura deserti TaxID=2268457 RepID=UPI003CCBC05C